jgi:hypothetical protein
MIYFISSLASQDGEVTQTWDFGPQSPKVENASPARRSKTRNMGFWGFDIVFAIRVHGVRKGRTGYCMRMLVGLYLELTARLSAPRWCAQLVETTAAPEDDCHMRLCLPRYEASPWFDLVGALILRCRGPGSLRSGALGVPAAWSGDRPWFSCLSKSRCQTAVASSCLKS